jgi:uncharacterized membrane protein YhaH (DUF805 family)
MSLSAPQSQVGRIARGPFVLAVGMVYLASFVSQMLLSAPVTASASVLPFIVVQAALIWAWIVLHQRRLRDAGRPAGIVVGIAMIYVLEVVLLALVVWMLSSSAGQSGDGDGASIFHLFAFFYLLAMMTGESNLAGMQVWLFGFAVVMFLPVVIAIVFSLWAATRPTLT